MVKSPESETVPRTGRSLDAVIAPEYDPALIEGEGVYDTWAFPVESVVPLPAETPFTLKFTVIPGMGMIR
jgi:hypothetical protein